MSSTKDAITSNLEYHTRLLDGISSLDYVPSAYENQTNYRAQLDGNIKMAEVAIKRLSKKTRKEQAEHQDLRDSSFRKVMYTIGGQKDKFQKKITKEEKEYLAALEEESNEKEKLKMLIGMRDEARRIEADLEFKLETYRAHKVELTNLYKRIFDGPTEEYPHDDELENEYICAAQHNDETSTRVNSEAQALKLLRIAEANLKRGLELMGDALQYSMMDIYTRGSYADMLEHRAIADASVVISKTDSLLSQARRICPVIPAIQGLEVPQTSFWGDVFFDNVYSDIAAHDRIQKANRRLTNAYTLLQQQIALAIRRANTAGADHEQASKTLRQARQNLDNFRRITFEEVKNGVAPPPSYDPPVYAPAGPPPSSSSSETSPSPSLSPSEPVQHPPAVPAPVAWGSRNPYAAAMFSHTEVTPIPDNYEATV